MPNTHKLPDYVNQAVAVAWLGCHVFVRGSSIAVAVGAADHFGLFGSSSEIHGIHGGLTLAVILGVGILGLRLKRSSALLGHLIHQAYRYRDERSRQEARLTMENFVAIRLASGVLLVAATLCLCTWAHTLLPPSQRGQAVNWFHGYAVPVNLVALIMQFSVLWWLSWIDSQACMLDVEHPDDY